MKYIYEITAIMDKPLIKDSTKLEVSAETEIEAEKSVIRYLITDTLRMNTGEQTITIKSKEISYKYKDRVVITKFKKVGTIKYEVT